MIQSEKKGGGKGRGARTSRGILDRSFMTICPHLVFVEAANCRRGGGGGEGGGGRQKRCISNEFSLTMRTFLHVAPFEVTRCSENDSRCLAASVARKQDRFLPSQALMDREGLTGDPGSRFSFFLSSRKREQIDESKSSRRGRFNIFDSMIFNRYVYIIFIGN